MSDEWIEWKPAPRLEFKAGDLITFQLDPDRPEGDSRFIVAKVEVSDETGVRVDCIGDPFNGIHDDK